MDLTPTSHQGLLYLLQVKQKQSLNKFSRNAGIVAVKLWDASVQSRLMSKEFGFVVVA